jgi:four helix bundle protein
MQYAAATAVKAKDLDDVLVYRDATEAADAVSAILERPIFCKDLELKNQLSRSSARIGPLIAEGFGQLTDKHVAVYLGRARGSCYETRSHLNRAWSTKYISNEEHEKLCNRYVVIGKKLSKWIAYLQRSNWKRRN